MNHRAPAKLVTLLVVGVATATAANASAGGRLSHAQYQAMLMRANAAVTRVETAAERGLTPKSTLAQAKALLLAWANTEKRLGSSFRAVAPPRNAMRANTLLSQGELMFGGNSRGLRTIFRSRRRRRVRSSRAGSATPRGHGRSTPPLPF